MGKNSITPERFDAALANSDLVWTADAIGRLVNRSGDYVRDTLAKLPGSPVKRIGRRYCASRRELDAFFRG